MSGTAIRTYLELRDPSQLRPRRVDDPAVLVDRVEQCAPTFWRSLYEGVGHEYHWVDRLSWTDAQIAGHLADPSVSLFVMTVNGGVAGYFELKRHDDGSVEVAYFGLLPDYQGRGLGAHLLSDAAERAWDLGPSRVWLHTSSLDHRAALSNYRSRGFTVVRAEDTPSPGYNFCRMHPADAPLWTPSDDRVARARITEFMRHVEERWAVAIPDYTTLYAFSIDRPDAFWQSVWDFCGVIGEPGERVVVDLDMMPGARFFPDARLNFTENILRQSGRGPALVFNGEGQRHRTLSHDELRADVARFASALRAAGVRAGDRIAGYVPNMPEAIVAALGAAAIGAVWSSCSPDFGVQGVLDRFGQIEPKVLVASDGYFYGGKTHDLRGKLVSVLEQLPCIERVVVIPYVDEHPPLDGLRNTVSWSDYLAGHSNELRVEQLPFDHPLYILYSSGTTGVPKCIVHGAGGTLIQHLKEHQFHCDIQAGDRVFYFTTCGWMMWNWLVTALASNATLLLYDGSPFHPDGRVLFDFADATRMTLFGTSARFIDAVNKAGLAPIDSHSLESVRTMTSTGSPLVPESFDFVYSKIRRDIHLASISGGTDIISCFVGGNPIGPVWRGEIQGRALGMKVEIYDDRGEPVIGEKGELVCTMPFPSMPVDFWNDPDGRKYHLAYFETYPGVWRHGDWAEITSHDGIIIYGRSDAVLNPGGVRIGTAEIYRQVEQLDEIVESLVIGQQWDHDERIVLFVRLRDGVSLTPALEDRIRRRIREHTTPRHVPTRIVQVPEVPRTKSGKIVELAVRDVVHGRDVKNREALANPEALEHFRNRIELST